MADAPYMYWVGLNVQPGTSEDDLSGFNDFYTNIHIREVVHANPGFLRATRYELQNPDPRGEFGPRWLTIYEMDGKAAAQGYIDRNDGPPEGRPVYSLGPPAWQTYLPWWRLIWRRTVPATGEIGANGAPYLYFVAMNVPAGTTAAEMQAFNDFYTAVHIPEVVEVSKFLGGTRYELEREFLHPAPGCPRFLAVYEADDESLRRLKHRYDHPEQYHLSSGPAAWEAHDTLWRLTYRRIAAYAK